MDENDLQRLLCEGDQKSVQKFKRCEPKQFKNSSHTAEVFGVLQSLRIDEAFCDIKLETDDSTVVLGHKIVLVSASPYFRAMFTSFEESNKHHIYMKDIDSTVLELLINYIYTGEIIVNEEHVQGLLAAANLIQLDYIKAACVEFLQTQLNPSNCFEIRALADLHNCTELMSSTDAYIKKQFLEVVKHDEFLSLSPEEVIQLISCSDLAVPFEEIVFESVINWVKHQLGSRKQFLHKLMEHVRLPLTSKQYLLKNVSEEPLFKNNPKCKDYVFEAIHFHLLKTHELIIIPKTIRCKPRCLQKVILICHSFDRTCWYDPASNLCHDITLKMNQSKFLFHSALIAEQYMFAVLYEGPKLPGMFDGFNIPDSQETMIQMLDLSSRTFCWVPINPMLVSRRHLRVGVLNNCIYAVGGFYNGYTLDSAEVFDVNFQEWRMVSSMCKKRSYFGIGVLNNLLYAVGGYDSSTSEYLNSVECYDPSLDTWNLVAPMSKRRSNFDIGVVDGVMYAVGGKNSSGYCKSVEAYRPSVGEWTSVADMPYEIRPTVVVALDGLLYVFCHSVRKMKVQIYHPNTNTWKLMETRLDGVCLINAAVVIDMPLHFTTQ